jgi:RNA-splicing ligase RtcB
LEFTFETNGKGNKFLEVQADINNNEMKARLYGIESNYGDFLLFKDIQP